MKHCTIRGLTDNSLPGVTSSDRTLLFLLTLCFQKYQNKKAELLEDIYSPGQKVERALLREKTA